VISAAKFGVAQKGGRSAPPARWLPGLGATTIDASRSIWENFNDQAAVIIQIESERGVILTSVGDQIDAVWIGTLDLRVSMGLDGMWGEEPEFQNAVQLYEETLRKHNKPNSGASFNENWTLGANKTFTVVAGDWLALLSQRDTIQSARQNLLASDKRQKSTEAKQNGNGLGVEVKIC
jgi:2-keto-3-deoxy-L-rhamnonate aldolase RhmA